MKQKVLKVHPSDNVLVALTNLKKGESIVFGNETYTLQDDINAKLGYGSAHGCFVGDAD